MRRVPVPSSTPLFRRVSVRQGWSQLSREPRDTAQSWEDSSSHMLPSAQSLLGTSLLWVSLFPWSVGFSIVLFLHTQYYLLSIFQKLLKSTVYWHKPTVSYLGVSVTEVLYFTHFGGGGGGRHMVIWSHVLNRKLWVYITPLWLKC